MANCDPQAEDFLQLRLDGRLDFSELVRQVICVWDGDREFASWKETWGGSSVASRVHPLKYSPLERPVLSRWGICLISALEAKDSVILLGKLLDKLLVLVKSTEVEDWIMKEWCLAYFFKSLTDMYSSSICLARLMSAALARMHMDMWGWGTMESLVGWRHISLQICALEMRTYFTIPEKHLSL